MGTEDLHKNYRDYETISLILAALMAMVFFSFALGNIWYFAELELKNVGKWLMYNLGALILLVCMIKLAMKLNSKMERIRMEIKRSLEKTPRKAFDVESFVLVQETRGFESRYFEKPKDVQAVKMEMLTEEGYMKETVLKVRILPQKNIEKMKLTYIEVDAGCGPYKKGIYEAELEIPKLN